MNGKNVNIQRLEPGDRLQLGRAQFWSTGGLKRAADEPSPGTSSRTLALAIGVAAAGRRDPLVGAGVSH